MKAEYCKIDKKILNIHAKEFDLGTDTREFIDIVSVDFPYDTKEILGSACDESGASKYYIEKGVLKLNDLTKDPIYIEHQIEKEVEKQKTIAALKEAKKVKPEYAKEIDKKIGAL